jgi:hypothetical protein
MEIRIEGDAHPGLGIRPPEKVVSLARLIPISAT